jgi:hypothetical protein
VIIAPTLRRNPAVFNYAMPKRVIRVRRRGLGAWESLRYGFRRRTNKRRRSMRTKALLITASIALAACATVGSEASTSWGKPGVSLVQYWTDSSECALAGAAAQNASGTNIDGTGTASDYSRIGGGSSGATGVPNDMRPVGTHGSEVDTNMYDVAARARYNAALQQRNADLARKAAVESCLTERGYHQFRLTAEQSAHAATLAEGSRERREYLHGLAADPAVQAAQGI